MQLGDKISNGTSKVNVKIFSYILMVMLISHNLRRKVEGMRITLVKLQFLCGSSSLFDGYENMTKYYCCHVNAIKGTTTRHYNSISMEPPMERLEIGL